MDIAKISLMARDWSDNVGKHIKGWPPEAKFVTGDYTVDRQIYYFEQESGIALQVSTQGGPTVIKGYDIVDEQKYICFLLRYS